MSGFDYALPLEEELLMGYNFFELYPIDGGGRFIFHDVLGTLDDREIAGRILRGGALSDFGDFPELDFKKHERWRTVEKSCWINRFYFLVPLAREYRLSGDESFARAAADCMLHFIRGYPPPSGKDEIGRRVSRVYELRDRYNRNTYLENRADETDIQYVWFDFQPASRIIHFIHAAHFLRGSSEISSSEQEEIHENIYRHAEVIFTEEEHFLQLKKGNHQSLRGLALLYAGCCFEGRVRGRDFLRKGIEICDFHAKNDFMPDGALGENSPSYHMFETWHLRDALLLSRLRGFRLSDELGEILKKAAGFIRALAQPDSYSPVINDGYGADTDVFLKSLPPAAPSKTGVKTHCFKDANMAVYREDGNYLLFDASPYTGRTSHYHGGKNAVSLWAGGIPFFVDSGCCSYDDELFSKWYKQSEAHSSLLVDGSPDSINEGTYSWTHYCSAGISGWKTESGGARAVESSLSSSNPAWEGVLWKRRVEVLPGFSIVISDALDFPGEKTFDFIFTLHPSVKAGLEKEKAVLSAGGRVMQLKCAGPAGTELFLSPGRCFQGFRHRQSERLFARVKASGAFTLDTEIKPG